jgi:hypothetical protein
MVETLARPQAPLRPPGPGRRHLAIIVVPLTVVAIAVLVVALLVVRDLGRGEPRFASLAEHPDSSLQGTIAYYAGRTGCVRIVAAAGQPSKDVLCLPAPDMSKAEQLGTKEDGPQLVWLADGRLEVTMFRSDPKSGAFSAGWQKIVDVRTGQTDDVAAADVPSSPNLTTRPAVSPSGQRITATSDASNGRIKVTLTEATGTRTLLSARGPGSYTYGLKAAFWAANWQWIAADDGRILIITPGEPSVTRVLTDETKEGRDSPAGLTGDDPRLSAFAVTGANILPAPG